MIENLRTSELPCKIPPLAEGITPRATSDGAAHTHADV